MKILKFMKASKLGWVVVMIAGVVGLAGSVAGAKPKAPKKIEGGLADEMTCLEAVRKIAGGYSWDLNEVTGELTQVVPNRHAKPGQADFFVYTSRSAYHFTPTKSVTGQNESPQEEVNFNIRMKIGEHPPFAFTYIFNPKLPGRPSIEAETDFRADRTYEAVPGPDQLGPEAKREIWGDLKTRIADIATAVKTAHKSVYAARQALKTCAKVDDSGGLKDAGELGMAQVIAQARTDIDDFARAHATTGDSTETGAESGAGGGAVGGTQKK